VYSEYDIILNISCVVNLCEPVGHYRLNSKKSMNDVTVDDAE